MCLNFANLKQRNYPELTDFANFFKVVFYTPWKPQKIKDFLRFSGGIEMKHWAKIG